MKRFIAAFAAALMLAVGVPGVASAVQTTSFSIDGHNPPTNTVDLAGWSAGGPQTFPGEYLGGIQSGDTLKFTLTNYKVSDGDWSFVVAAQDTSLVSAKYIGGASLNELEQNSYPQLAYFKGNGSPIEVTITLVAAMDPLQVWSGGWGSIAVLRDGYDNGAANDWIFYVFNSSGEAEVDPLTTSRPITKRNGISFTPDNFDPTCAYEISTSAGTAKQDPVTGEVNVYGVGSGSSVSVTITDCTGATATVSGKATAATAPVQTLTKPTVTSSAELITCSAGTSTVNPSSIAYTLLVDGVAVSTRFSDGSIAPSLVATTSAQNLYSGATLSKATWFIDPTWAGKSYSCTTTSYADGAVGIANS